jgi:type I restriction enzyme S subunit
MGSDMFERLRLADVADLAMGETIIAEDCDGRGLPIYSAATNDAPWNHSTRFSRRLKKGTIVIGARGSIGFPRMPANDQFGATQTTITVVARGDSVLPRFLFHVLRGIDFKALTSQQAIPMLTVAEFGGVSLPRPPIKEQGKVVEILDTLDTTIRQTEAMIEKLKQVKQGLLHDLLTRGIDANGELRLPQSQAPHLYKDSPLGWIPREWEAKALNDLVDQRRPIVYGILMPGQGHEGGVPVVKVKDIVGGSILLDQLLLTSPAIDLEYKRSRLKPGDLLFTIRGSVGRTAFVPAQLEDANITQDTARIGIAGVDARFVREYLAMPLPVRFIATHTLGVAVQGINLRDVRRIPIAVPRPDEATEIADRLDATNDRVTAEALEVQKLALTKAGLMDDLLTGRVRVTPLLA